MRYVLKPQVQVNINRRTALGSNGLISPLQTYSALLPNCAVSVFNLSYLTTMLAPRSASLRAVAAPMPLLAPAVTTTLFCNGCMV